MTRTTPLADLPRPYFDRIQYAVREYRQKKIRNRKTTTVNGKQTKALQYGFLILLWTVLLSHTTVVHSNTVPSKVITPIDECNSLYKHKKISQREFDALIGLSSNPIRANNDSPVGDENQSKDVVKIAINLCYADLSGVSLKNRKLSHIDFSGANLSGVDFERAQISNSVFNGAQLIKTNLRDTQITNSSFLAANFELADLANAVIDGSQFSWTYMRNALLLNTMLQQSQFHNVDFQYANLAGAVISSCDFVDADFRYGSLDNAKFVSSNVQNSQFMQNSGQSMMTVGSNFYNSKFPSANLQHANFQSTNLLGSDFTNSNLNGVRFENVNLEDANWLQTNINDIYLNNVDVKGLRFEVASMDNVAAELFTNVSNLSLTRYEISPRALLNLRGEFKTAGLRQKEREITYAIEKSETELLSENDSPMSKIESYVKIILFDLPTAWGLEPSRAFQVLAWSILIFAFPYTFVIVLPFKGKGAIWQIHQDKLLNNDETSRLYLPSIAKGVRIGFYFSILSAFQIGVREYNISDWLIRLQPNAYLLQATGWVRTLVGLQALISVFLFASWLASFARPFE